MALTSTSSVSDVFKCELLTRYLVEDVLGILELDGTAGENSAIFDSVRRLRLSCESRRASAISDSTCTENIREGWEDWVKCGNILAEPHGKAGVLELLCVSGSKVDILYQQEVFFDGRAFTRLRHYHFPALIILAMSTECFISCIHIGNVWVANVDVARSGGGWVTETVLHSWIHQIANQNCTTYANL
jgi:hypothetical protein